MLLIKGVTVFAPERLGTKDVLLAGGKVCAIQDSIEPGPGMPVDVIDGSGKLLLPGFVDSHVHILGGGGEGGYATRTPELKLSDMIRAGVTTVVGCLGTDGISRRMENLIVKAKQLKSEGVSCYLYTGSYDIPVRTFLSDIRSDLMFIEEIIGVGEIALADHRSSQPTYEEFARIVADVRVGGMLSGKGGVVNIHLGDDKQMLEYLERLLEESSIPAYHMIPTHINRNPYLFQKGIEYAKNGGYVDITTGSYLTFADEGELKPSGALKQMLDAGVSSRNITFSSDGQGSLPVFNAAGETIALTFAREDTLYQEVRDAVLQDGIPLETALKSITSNVADHLKLPHKGRVQEGGDADLVLVDQDSLEIQTVIALGQVMLRSGELLVKGNFE